MSRTRRAALGGAALAAFGALAACETTAGLGRDMEAAGVAIQREAAAASRSAPRPLPPPGAVRVEPLPPAR